MRKLNRIIAGSIIGLLAVATLAACGADQTKETHSESKTRDSSYSALVKRDPAQSMSYSPTRKTINAWVKTWNVPGQLAFTYILNQAGEKVGYFVFQGPPVSMCAALTPTWTYEGTPDDGDTAKDQRVPAPSIDGVYYSGSQCLSYYGIDAATGRYLEFSIGGTQNYITATQPLDLNVPPLGYTKIADLKKENGAYVKP